MSVYRGSIFCHLDKSAANKKSISKIIFIFSLMTPWHIFGNLSMIIISRLSKLPDDGDPWAPNNLL